MRFKLLLGFALATSTLAVTACKDERRETLHFTALADPAETAPRPAATAQPGVIVAQTTIIDVPDGGARTQATETQAAIAPPAASPAASPTGGTVIAAANGEARIPDPYRLPGSDQPQVGGMIHSRGASTLIGQVKVEPGKLVLDLTGGKAGRYSVYRGEPGGCAPAPAPAEMVSGQVDLAARTGGDIADPKRTERPASTKIGDISMGADGIARFETTIGKTDAQSMTILIEEQARSANPSLADSTGLVACGQIDLSAANPRG